MPRPKQSLRKQTPSPDTLKRKIDKKASNQSKKARILTQPIINSTEESDEDDDEDKDEAEADDEVVDASDQSSDHEDDDDDDNELDTPDQIKPKATSSSNKPLSNQSDTKNTQSPSNLVNNRTIYVEGLPYTSNESEVRSYFSECGIIKSVRLPVWHDTGRLRGYGHVEFNNEAGAKKAFDLDGTLVSYLTVCCCQLYNYCL